MNERMNERMMNGEREGGEGRQAGRRRERASSGGQTERFASFGPLNSFYSLDLCTRNRRPPWPSMLDRNEAVYAQHM